MSSRVLPGISIRKATPRDAQLLSGLAASTFHDTFAAHNTAEDMARYVASAFNVTAQRNELSDISTTVFIADCDGDAVGYVMLRAGPVPGCVGDAATIEIARLYSVQRMIGEGVGAALMQRALAEVRGRSMDSVWLGVWEKNARAIAFYERWGFVDVGTLLFTLGSDIQTDRVMVRRTGDGA